MWRNSEYHTFVARNGVKHKIKIRFNDYCMQNHYANLIVNERYPWRFAEKETLRIFNEWCPGWDNW